MYNSTKVCLASVLIVVAFILSSCAPGTKVVRQDYTPSSADIVAVVDPCGTAPGIYNEVFFRLYNGQLVASFSDSSSGSNTRLVLVPAGNYITTDGDNCYFTVDARYNIINEHH